MAQARVNVGPELGERVLGGFPGLVGVEHLGRDSEHHPHLLGGEIASLKPIRLAEGVTHGGGRHPTLHDDRGRDRPGATMS